ncbi:hypothetical protein [Stygiolobus caldivivus]|uniref:Uncharacterized protein n=1 Tax=Stygiolobus caldivivus TaxID=2824673 RepID=A0A8D5ZCZ5_9CREN|nr:hypothetical protein [Stygiolobus caldivivus]BCU68833.1 hypothetical protein KN1_01300 [Stygiolobus caldivivus]
MARLVCLNCGHEERVPMHCGREMVYVLKGNFRKYEYLRCQVCGYEVTVPLHCSIPMLYTDEDYLPISALSKSEIEEMKKIYGG